jgi:hypothetical protein
MKVFLFSHKELKFMKNKSITPLITIENYTLQINERIIHISLYLKITICKKMRILNLPLSLKIMINGTMKLLYLPL